jgi:hypothetical protein
MEVMIPNPIAAMKKRMRRKIKPKGMTSGALKPKKLKVKSAKLGNFGKTKGY